MSKAEDKLKYKNETDRCYGLAGMAVSLAALDALDKVISISLDADGPMVTFSYDYYFSGSPIVSPKAMWNNMVESFQLTSALAISNIMSRCVIREKKDLRQDLINLLYERISLEGRESCDLDDDEIRPLFDKTLNYTRRLFANRRLHPLIDEFAGTIAKRRVLTAKEIRDELHALQII